MNLMKPKNLYMVEHKTNAEKSLNSDMHTRQTNPGYSRNKFGGFYTKWVLPKSQNQNDAINFLLFS